MKKLAIIPARGGSKRIPHKNIREFLGKPIIAYSITTAINSGLFDEVMVSTDDYQIADIAKEYGANIPFIRSKKNSDDNATTPDVIEEVIQQYSQKHAYFKIFCCIYPTAPLINTTRLKEGFDLLINNNFDSVFPIVRFGYPIQRALKQENEKISMIWPENYTKRSQDLKPSFHDAGQFYWMWTERFLTKKKIFTDNSGAIIISQLETQDIDNENDWKLAELKYKYLIKQD